MAGRDRLLAWRVSLDPRRFRHARQTSVRPQRERGDRWIGYQPFFLRRLAFLPWDQHRLVWQLGLRYIPRLFGIFRWNFGPQSD